ncbi:hypothetical protein [Glutamicibacter sp. NPDC087344]
MDFADKIGQSRVYGNIFLAEHPDSLERTGSVVQVFVLNQESLF